MKTANPRYNLSGEVNSCADCPLDGNDVSVDRCRKWWHRNGLNDELDCPTAETYAEACLLAEAEAQK